MPHGKPKNTSATIKRLWGYVAAYKFRLVLVLFCMLISTLTSLIGGYMLAPIINRITQAVAPDAEISFTPIGKIADNIISKVSEIPVFAKIVSLGDFAEVAVYVFTAIFIMLTIYLLGVLSSYLQARIMLTVSQNATEKIRNELFEKLMKLPTRYFDSTPTGETMSRFTNDVDNIDVMLNNSLTSVVSGFITILGTMVFMITTNIWLTLITVVFIPLFVKGGAWIGSKSRKYHSGQQAALGAVNGYIEETVTGQKVVKVFNHEETCVDEFELLNDDMRDKQFKAQFYGGIMGPIMHNLSMISYAVTIGVGGVLMCLTGFGPGDLTVFANYSRQFSMPINQLSMQINTVFAALAGAERVFGIMDAEPELPDVDNAKSGVAMKGFVEVKDVTFGYNPDKVILKNISLYAKPGQKIAFVGSTGAGKTTITN
ncbi:MAG: ABC transporter ATP-binding protein, partial [Clostridia bacterium]|nr:ABC transporter ATP-binding protein [Clostridia bacterium]